jgi:hypothetical protein
VNSTVWQWQVIGIEHLGVPNENVFDRLVRVKLAMNYGPTRLEVQTITTFDECPNLGDVLHLRLEPA